MSFPDKNKRIAVFFRTMSFRSLGGDFLFTIVRQLHREAHRRGWLIEFYDRLDDLPTFFQRERDRFFGFIGIFSSRKKSELFVWNKIRARYPCVDLFARQKKGLYVGCDELAAMELLVEHLVSEGHRDIGFFSYSGEAYAKERFKGFRLALKRHHLPLQADFIRQVSGFRPSTPLIHFEYFLSIRRRPTAIVFEDDEVARNFSVFANSKGVRIPENLAITGINNQKSFHGKRPWLTTIDQNIPLVIRRAMDLLEAHRHSPPAGERDGVVFVKPKLVIRRSSLRRSLAGSENTESLKTAISGAIREHFAESGLTKILASRFGFSPLYFLKKFKALFGESFASKIHRERLSRAEYLLRTTNRSVTMIYLDCGFSSHVNFNKQFKKRFGMTAGAWRGKHRVPLPKSTQ